ncbi:sodium/potassium-transporting ATPase subunit gamma isoform X3 [Choloepus didactylus]|uniref:sodium/potassium-transporting ATPase subunit gamma isoform X3 n=1 Tax=Choloepus didactylus TaxID=27675 RepID=UPI00189DAC05|nr:sodium/potassium-transporting ATPase subunit gamma isoform X3 [Choloepus didactylus]
MWPQLLPWTGGTWVAAPTRTWTLSTMAKDSAVGAIGVGKSSKMSCNNRVGCAHPILQGQWQSQGCAVSCSPLTWDPITEKLSVEGSFRLSGPPGWASPPPAQCHPLLIIKSAAEKAAPFACLSPSLHSSCKVHKPRLQVGVQRQPCLLQLSVTCSGARLPAEARSPASPSWALSPGAEDSVWLPNARQRGLGSPNAQEF